MGVGEAIEACQDLWILLYSCTDPVAIYPPGGERKCLYADTARRSNPDQRHLIRRNQFTCWFSGLLKRCLPFYPDMKNNYRTL